MTPARLESLYLVACRDVAHAEAFCRRVALARPFVFANSMAARASCRFARAVRIELEVQFTEVLAVGTTLPRDLTAEREPNIAAWREVARQIAEARRESERPGLARVRVA